MLFMFLSADLCPQIAAYYGNRAATHIMLGGFKSALEDANQSISIDESFLKVTKHSICLYHLTL